MDYKQRKLDMQHMRFVEGKTLDEIAKEHGGLSRERIRQILGNTGKDFRRKWTYSLKDKTTLPKNLTELRSYPGVRRVWLDGWGQTRHETINPNSAVGDGQKFESLALQILIQNGISSELMPNAHPYDLETKRGKRIDVKMTRTDVSRLKSQRNEYPTYQVNHIKSGRDCDFLFVFVPDDKYNNGYTYFVIPSFEIRHLSVSTCIRIPWPTLSWKPSKWHKYHKRLDLLA